MRVTPQMDWVEPRSTSSHCGSENALDQRVPVLPTVALAAGKKEFSSDDAVVGWFSARLAVPQVAAPAFGAAVTARSPVRASAALARTATIARRGDLGNLTRLISGRRPSWIRMFTCLP